MDGIPNIDFDINIADVVTVPIDKTLSVEGEAADAKAVGDALKGKADKSEIATAIKVNDQGADQQGEIVLLAEHIPMDQSANPKSVAEEVAGLKGRTGADIPVNAEPGARSIEAALGEIDSGATVEDGVLRLAGAVADESTEAHDIRLGDQVLPMRDAGAVRSVNGTAADADGNVAVTRVEFANNLVADDAQANLGAFVIRTSGGTTSIADGDAWVARLRGRIEHTGQVAEVLTCEVHAAAREEGESPITAALDAEAFKAAVTESAVFTLTYTTEWSANPELIGVTVTGEPVAGDEIVVTYVKADRGVITPATPASFRSTGWNLYNHSAGYARVVKYSSQYGFRVEGAYTSLSYSATPNGEREAISPVNGHFNVPADGYVWVTGGSASSTCLYMTWSDWTDGHEGGFEPYTESVVDLTELMAEYFPDGLLAVGAVADEIDFALQRATVAIETLPYSDEAVADLDAAGCAYEADESTIYAVRLSPQTIDLRLDNRYAVSDHGLELFTGTSVAVEAATLYGQNLRDKLRTDVLTISQQALTPAQQAQVQANIGASVKFVTPAFSSLPKTFYHEGITADMEVVEGSSELSNPAAQTGDWTVTTAAGSLTITGSISGSTTLKFKLEVPTTKQLTTA